MSQTTIKKRFLVDGVATDPTSIKLSDATATYGVRRTDTSATVVADNTAMTKVSTGVYTHTFTDPASDLTYEYVVEIVYAGETYRFRGTVAGGTSDSENLYDLTKYIAPYVGGVPDEILKQQLRIAARDFLIETEIWQEDLTAFDTVANQEDYTLTWSHNADILRVRGVTVDDSPWTYSFSADQETLSLDPVPATSGNDVVVSVTFEPYESNTELPSALLRRWGFGIAEECKWILKSMAKVPWSDPQGAKIAYERYREYTCQAKRESLTQRESGTIQCRPRAFV